MQMTFEAFWQEITGDWTPPKAFQQIRVYKSETDGSYVLLIPLQKGLGIEQLISIIMSLPNGQAGEPRVQCERELIEATIYPD